MKRKVVTNWKIVFDTQEEEKKYDDTIYVSKEQELDYDHVLNFGDIEYLDSEISRIIQDMGLWVGDDVWGTDE
tara:strand:- start:191 stop:409 length:219 start_codon:yes stop_codon:yes gene_type:complete